MNKKKGIPRTALERVISQFRGKVETALNSSVQVILYGSYAREEETWDSDVDLLVIVPKLDKSALDKILEAAWEVGFEAGVVLSVIPVAQEELKTLAASPFLQAVQSEGIPL
nr:nucleotidyltransferase domain-containing protein [Chloroflexota bacterium]